MQTMFASKPIQSSSRESFAPKILGETEAREEGEVSRSFPAAVKPYGKLRCFWLAQSESDNIRRAFAQGAMLGQSLQERSSNIDDSVSAINVLWSAFPQALHFFGVFGSQCCQAQPRQDTRSRLAAAQQQIDARAQRAKDKGLLPVLHRMTSCS